MKDYLGFTSKRRKLKDNIISGLVIAAFMNITAVIIIIGAVIILKSAEMQNIKKEKSDAAFVTVKRKANHIIKNIRDKNRILSRGMKLGFHQISRDIIETVAKVFKDLK